MCLWTRQSCQRRRRQCSCSLQPFSGVAGVNSSSNGQKIAKGRKERERRQAIEGSRGSNPNTNDEQDE